MKVLILGTGGREHALARRLSQDPDVTEVITAPGNPGAAAHGRCVGVDLTSPADILALAARESVDLTVVGPEAVLERGVVDLFRRERRPIVGPTQAGAALECSKVYSKAFMARHSIPTARFVVCDTADAAFAAVAGASFGFPVVVKADGLAAGKGVTVAADRAEAESAIRAAMIDKQFGASGARVVIEECLTGPEVSLFFLLDGIGEAEYLGSAQDHKRIFDDDLGPNTGGMGAFAPSPLVNDTLLHQVHQTVLKPVIEGFKSEGDGYTGFLYVSLMLTKHGPKVIEFNVRLGDPETQVILPLLEGDLSHELLWSTTVLAPGLRFSTDKTVGVVIASRGYPASSDAGREIFGLERAAAIPGVAVFHSGTKIENGRVLTAGGRVLTVVGRGATYEDAMTTAYRGVDAIQFDGMQYRRDIGRKAVER